MRGSTNDQDAYVTTAVVTAITAVIAWIVFRQVFGRQAAALRAADGPVNLGAPLMTLGEIGAIMLGMAIAYSVFAAVRAYKRAGDSW